MNSTRSPARTLRVSGPVSITSDQTHRRMGVAAVAGIRRPPLDFRSPSPGTATRMRSAVSRIWFRGSKRTPPAFPGFTDRSLVVRAVTPRILGVGGNLRTHPEWPPLRMMPPVPTADEIIGAAERTLKASVAIEHPHAGKERFDAERLLAFVLGHEAEEHENVSPRAYRRFEGLLDRRAGGEPVPYITGYTDFAGLRLGVGRGSFIPRESSEFVVEQATRRLRHRREPVHVDVATGVGTIALAVASAVPHAAVIGLDLHAAPLSWARRNARRLGLRNVRFLRGDLFAPLPQELRGDVDTISLHPPYIGRRELRDLPEEMRRFEPEESLTDRSPKGLGLLGRVVRESPKWLRPGGWLLIEVSPDRSRDVAALMRRAGLTGVRSTKGGVEVSRVVVGRAD